MNEKKNPVCGVSSSSKPESEIIDEASEDTFPASDAPSSGQITSADDCVDEDTLENNKSKHQTK
ncbi:hypothetical protein [Acetobacter conturbans]|uniref:Uncharacterized protein n=1 Tax=Acetobacter conturbans TaxID=1737472 RepID=A0ABX0JX47_9PROT|nr:hypothetical protein [Acetobacter conturbans]NHN87570.1 hypothetical protein [Acetobacter conturbans]